MSNSGESLPIAWRMKKEGADVDIYIHNPAYRKNYNGIMEKTGLDNLKKQLSKAELVIFDITRPNAKEKQDIALLKMFGIKVGSESVFGPVADKLKKDVRVIGASVFTERLELDRKLGMETAKKAGFKLPKAESFKSLAEGARFLKGRNGLWVFKPENNQDLDLTYVEKFPGELYSKILDEYIARLDDKCEFLLQEKIDGVEVSSEVWVNSEGPAMYNQTIESKRLMNNDLGPAIGSQSNTVYLIVDDGGVIVEPLKKIASILRKEGYEGPCDANCIIKNSVPYFLEWSPRFGWDALYCLLSLLKGKITDFFKGDFTSDFNEGFAVSQRLSIPPYPYAVPLLRRLYAKDVSIMGKLKDYKQLWAEDVYDDNGILKCAGADGIIGAVTATGQTPDEAWGRLYNKIKKIKVCSYVQYRTDSLKMHKERLSKLKVV